MSFLISFMSQTPIYEQIKMQIKEKVLSGALRFGDQLPSIRLMAKDLKVGMVTVKRAYDDLCDEGFAISHAGKGFYIADINEEKIRSIHVKILQERLLDIKNFCITAQIPKEEIIEIINKLYGGH